MTTEPDEFEISPTHSARGDNSQPDDTTSSTSIGLKARFGLPTNFVPRFQRHGRLLLLEENIYSLPDGKEFVPCRPTGTLAANSHLYALLTVSQFERGERGSVFIRLDGRLFDYSTDQRDPTRDIFDTGYTIQDLERTGRYASRASQTFEASRQKQRQKVKRSKAGKAKSGR